MIYAVDFDGTLCSDNYPDIGVPNYYLINKLREMHKKGDKLILWTCRQGEPLNDALNACHDWQLPIDAVNVNLPEIIENWKPKPCGPKIFAHVYLDDRAVNVKDF